MATGTDLLTMRGRPLLLSHEATRGVRSTTREGSRCACGRDRLHHQVALPPAPALPRTMAGVLRAVSLLFAAAAVMPPLGDCMALLFGCPPGPAADLPSRSRSGATASQQLLILGMNPQRATWEAALDAMPAISSLACVQPPRPLHFKDAWGRYGLPAALAQVGGPRPSLGGGIADALALLPDLKSSKEAAATSGALSRRR